jgi:hypothetical protein
VRPKRSTKSNGRRNRDREGVAAQHSLQTRKLIKNGNAHGTTSPALRVLSPTSISERSIRITPSSTSTGRLMPPSGGCGSGVPWTDDCGSGAIRRGGSNLRRRNRAFPGAGTALWRQRIDEDMGPKPSRAASPPGFRPQRRRVRVGGLARSYQVSSTTCSNGPISASQFAGVQHGSKMGWG